MLLCEYALMNVSPENSLHRIYRIFIPFSEFIPIEILSARIPGKLNELL